MTDHHLFTQEEQYKFTIIKELLQKKMTNSQAAKMLQVTIRQIQRLKQAVKKDGIQAVVHGLKGRTSNYHIADAVKEQAIEIIRKNYSDFKPGFATEKLKENHSLFMSPETVRSWMTAEKLWKPGRGKKSGIYRSWRPRKEYYGQMQQFDGSYHEWFEGRYQNTRGEIVEMCLLLSIDDATGKITKAQFADNEGVVAVYIFWLEYCLLHGKPLSIYLDRYSTYKINHKNAVDNIELMTQFQRTAGDLAVELITAHSAQAKGRIERLFLTLQDRLVKEMRLVGINTPEEGNKFLEDIFIPKFNQKFAVVSAEEGNVHRPLTNTDRKCLNRIFSIQSVRTVNNDFTIQFKNHWYQLAEIQPTTIQSKDVILVEEWLDTTIHFSFKEHYLLYTMLPQRPKKVRSNPVILTTHKLNWVPAFNHPWRQGFPIKY